MSRNIFSSRTRGNVNLEQDYLASRISQRPRLLHAVDPEAALLAVDKVEHLLEDVRPQVRDSLGPVRVTHRAEAHGLEIRAAEAQQRRVGLK